MATSPPLRGSSTDHAFHPETPESKPALTRTPTSMSVPRNELLRKTLEARRAQDSPQTHQSSSRPMSLDNLPPRPPAPTPSARPQQLDTPATSSDPFDEFDLPADLVAPESPIQKRHLRTKDDTPPRGKTNQELSAEVQKLRKDLMTEKMRCELTKKQQEQEHEELVKANKEVDRLNYLALEMREVEAENRQLRDLLEKHQQDMDEIDDMKDHIDQLQAERDAVEEQKRDLQAEFDDMKKATDAELANMQDALKEAVDLVHSIENEQANLVKENNDLKSEKERLRKELRDCAARIAAIESQRVDGSPEYNQQPFVDTSLDEYRPATSLDDSDYYSQPATPRADIDKDAQSLRSVTSTRSRQFLELARERTKSARRLSLRMSDASMRAANVVSAVHVPEVPRIPEEHALVTPRAVDERSRERRYRQSAAEPVIARSEADLHRPATVTPVQTHQPSGLRNAYRPDQMQRTSTSRPSSSQKPGSGMTPRPHTRGHSAVELIPLPPPRMSSRHAHTSSEIHLRPQPSDATFESNTTCGTLIGTEEQKPEQVLTTWTSANPRTSAVSLLTTSPRIDLADRDRWWKDTEHVKPLLRTRATTKTLRADFSSDDAGLGSETFAVRAGGIRTTPTTPAAEKPQEDFLFNPKENEEDFMRKAIGRLKGSIRRRHNESL
ncbi:hypothetical protein E8E11_010231 [Didymella keratinophila]|nr:hypothetical protein E8E11_010231 [Didymella keratinophila]